MDPRDAPAVCQLLLLRPCFLRFFHTADTACRSAVSLPPSSLTFKKKTNEDTPHCPVPKVAKLRGSTVSKKFLHRTVLRCTTL
jgi:hypothetical protein